MKEGEDMLLEHMIRTTTDLTPIEAEIGAYILKHRREVLDFSIMELSEEIHVSKSAVHRFCKKIGIKGFNELKVHLADELAKQKEDEAEIDVNYPFNQEDGQGLIAEKILKLYEATIEDTFNYIDVTKLQQVSSLLHHANIIDVYTHAHNMNPAENFQDKMLTIGQNVNCPKTFYKQRSTALASDNDHVALILSYSGKATFIEPIVEILYKKRVPMIIIGKVDCNQFPQYIKHTIYISGKENLRDRISQFSSHIAMQYMLDVIYSCIYNMDREKNIRYLKNVIQIMDDRQIIDT